MLATDKKDKVWQAVLAQMEMSISKANFTTWFKSTYIEKVEDNHLTVSVPHTFAQDWLQKKYNNEIKSTLQSFYPEVKNITYKVIPPQQETTDEIGVIQFGNQPNQSQKEESSLDDESNINLDNVFDKFIVGNSNRLAHAAAMAVVKNPGQTGYNPLYLYGDVGLGKTHLLQAIGNEFKKLNPNKKVLYASCERFTSEFIQALQTKRMENFKKKYRNVDMFLVDDIQFLSGKEGIQEEFFHTFNTLHQTKRQIVMTSDTKPQSISHLPDRLTSRLGWGMVADIKQPDFETRQAILKHKCQERSIHLDDELIEYVAQHIQNNIRELEGTLNKIIAHCELYNVPASMKLIETIIQQAGNDNQHNRISAEDICKHVAGFYSIKLEDILGKRRNKELVYPRQILMYLLRVEKGYSYPKIGKILGGKDHTTVIHGVEKVEKNLNLDEDLQKDITSIKKQLYN